MLMKENQQPSPFVALASGSLAGMLSQLFIYPLDVLRTRVQSSGQSVSSTFTSSLKRGGVRNLYAGLSFPLSAQAVYKANIFGLNSVLSANFDSSAFLCGAAAGSFNAALFVTPVELIRNRVIAGNSKIKPFDVINKLSSKSGFDFRQLYKGVRVTVSLCRLLFDSSGLFH